MSQLRQEFRIEEWTVDPESNRLDREGSSVSLEPRQMDLLVFLAENQGRTVSKDEIFESVWQETYVTDSTLWKTISGLRQALEEDPKDPKLIVTVPRRGYRLEGKVEPVAQVGAPMSVEAPTARDEPPASASNRWIFGAGIAVGLVIVAFLAWSATLDSFDSTDLSLQHPTVLLVPLENRTGDERLDRTLEVILQTRLNDSGRVRMVARPRVEDALRLMREPDDTSLTPQVARRVAQRDGAIDRIVTGHIGRVGSLYQVSVQVRDVDTYDLLGSSERYSESPEDLVPQANDLAAWLVAELAQGVAVDQAALPERVTTNSLAALRFYTRGVEAYQAMRHAEAIPLFQQAVEIDPEFASAYLMLFWSWMRSDSGNPSRVEEGVAIFKRRPQFGSEMIIRQSAWDALEKAMELKDLNSQAERAFIQGCYYDWQDNFEKATVFYQLVTEFEPEHHWAWNNLRWAANASRNRDAFADSLAARAEIMPTRLPAQYFVAASLLEHGYVDRAAKSIQRLRALARELPPADDRADSDVVLALGWLDAFDAWNPWREGRYAEAVQQTDRMAQRLESEMTRGIDQEPALYFLAALYLMQGRLQKAEELLLQFDLYPDFDSVSSPATLIAFLYENADPLGPEVATRKVSPGLRPVARLLFAPDSFPNEPREPTTGFRRTYFEAVLPLLNIIKERDPENRSVTVEGLNNLSENLDYGIYPPEVELSMRWLLARELDAMGREEEAIEVRERILADRNRTLAGGAIIWQKAALELVNSYRECGRLEEAEALEADLRAMLQFADPDHPILKQLDATGSR